MPLILYLKELRHITSVKKKSILLRIKRFSPNNEFFVNIFMTVSIIYCDILFFKTKNYKSNLRFDLNVRHSDFLYIENGRTVFLLLNYTILNCILTCLAQNT